MICKDNYNDSTVEPENKSSHHTCNLLHAYLRIVELWGPGNNLPLKNCGDLPLKNCGNLPLKNCGDLPFNNCGNQLHLLISCSMCTILGWASIVGLEMWRLVLRFDSPVIIINQWITPTGSQAWSVGPGAWNLTLTGCTDLESTFI